MVYKGDPMADLRIVLRGLVCTPLFTLVAVLSLALGIGANTAIFSLLEQVMLRTLPVQDPHELVYLYSEGPWMGAVESDEQGGPSFSHPLFRELREQQTPFAGLAGARSYSVSLASSGEASFGQVRIVSGNYFGLLRVGAALGRLIEEDDDRVPGTHPVAVLGYRYWESRFGADVGILNQTVLVNNSPMTVIGVAQKGFAGERAGNPPDIYIPMAMWGVVGLYADSLSDRRLVWVTMFGRLKPGVTLERAEVEINVSYRAQLEQDIPLIRRPSERFLELYRARTITLKPGEHGRGDLREQSGQPFMLITGMTLLILLLVCANVANLQLARGAARMGDLAVRSALGASRMQLARLVLVESSVLAIAGGVLGLGVAHLTARGILAAVPAWRGLDAYLSPDLDAGALLFCFGLSVATGLAFGLFPALRASGVSLALFLKGQAGQVSMPRSATAFRKALVTLQVAITLLLLITSGLFVTTLVNLSRIDLGMRTDHLATFGVFPRMNRYSDTQTAQLHQRLTERLAAIPGVTLVSTAQTPRLTGSAPRTNIGVEGYSTEDGRNNPTVHVNWIGEAYFRTMGIPLITGREFTPADNAGGSKVAIVNEAFGRKFLPVDRSVLGAHITERNEPWRIVGVVKNAAEASMREMPQPAFYKPLRQTARWGPFHFYMRTTIPPENALAVVRREVAAVEPTLPIRALKTMETQLAENTYAERILSTLTSTFAALATLLAVVGLYGVLAYSVARRRREFGIRMALGAESSHIRRLVTREVAAVMIVGTCVGLGSAAVVGQLIRSALYGLEPWNAQVYLAAVAIVWSAALTAAYLPARRAARLNPVAALRHE